jgi:hypothetical protein
VSSYNVETIAQLKILDFKEISKNVWKLQVEPYRRDVFEFIVVQMNKVLKPIHIEGSLFSFCEEVSKHQKEVENGVAVIKKPEFDTEPALRIKKGLRK